MRQLCHGRCVGDADVTGAPSAHRAKVRWLATFSPGKREETRLFHTSGARLSGGPMLRSWWRQALVVVLFLLIASCSGGGCSSGCSSCGVAPIAGGFDPAKTIPNSASERASRSTAWGSSARTSATLVSSLLGTRAAPPASSTTRHPDAHRIAESSGSRSTSARTARTPPAPLQCLRGDRDRKRGPHPGSCHARQHHAEWHDTDSCPRPAGDRDSDHQRWSTIAIGVQRARARAAAAPTQALRTSRSRSTCRSWPTRSLHASDTRWSTPPTRP